MARNFFDNLPSTTTPLTAPRLNGLLDGDEAMGNIVVDSIRGKNLFNINGEVNVRSNTGLVDASKNTVSGNVLTCGYNNQNDYAHGQKFTNLNGKTFTFSARCISNGTGTGIRIFVIDNGTSISNQTITNGNTGSLTYTATSNNIILAFSTVSGENAQLTDIQVEIGSSKTDYAEFQGVGYVSGQNSNGEYVKYDDGTLIQWGTIDKSNFIQSGDVYSTIQGIKFYRSAAFVRYMPINFINTDFKVFPNAQQGFTSGASRLGTIRIQKNTEGSFEIQIIGVEPYTTSGNGYINLLAVDWLAIGKWK